MCLKFKKKQSFENNLCKTVLIISSVFRGVELNRCASWWLVGGGGALKTGFFDDNY